MNIKLLTFIVAVSVFATGCVTHYRYESTGMVTSSSATESRALIYWFADEGGLWYDKDQAVLDSDVTMRVCGGLPKTFVPFGEDPASYPRGGRYKFAAVTRTKINDDRDPAGFCGIE